METLMIIMFTIISTIVAIGCIALLVIEPRIGMFVSVAVVWAYICGGFTNSLQ